jgi:predicted phosphodiesterase
MKLIAIGDIHGREVWNEIVKHEQDCDQIVFIGDYFDSKENIPASLQIDNFKDICDLKRNSPDKVTLLFGNHDWHYLRTSQETYSGFQQWHKTDISEVIHQAISEDLLQMAFVHDKYLFSHAGVTKTWLANNGYESGPVDEFINSLFKYQPNRFRFTAGENMSEVGDDITQSPIWVRERSLLEDGVVEFIQVVGHTHKCEVTYLKEKVIIIDALFPSKEYLVIKNGVVSNESVYI